MLFDKLLCLLWHLSYLNRFVVICTSYCLQCKSYEVIFTNGDKVEFDNKGNWEEVNCKYSAVPAAIIPATIQKYVTTNYPDAKILKIERDKKDYEVKLSNRTELKFDLKFNLIDIDF